MHTLRDAMAIALARVPLHRLAGGHRQRHLRRCHLHFSCGSNLDASDCYSNGLKLFQDGLPVTPAASDNHNRFLDPMAACQVAVACGANVLSFGASNLSGALARLWP